MRGVRLFLAGTSAVYLCAILSLYSQLQGLYGCNGLLPVASLFARFDAATAAAPQQQHPLQWELALFRWFAQVTQNEHDVDTALHLFVLLALALACVSLVLPSVVVYAALYVMYSVIVVLGQSFFTFQWDLLLCETGFVAVVCCWELRWVLVGEGGWWRGGNDVQGKTKNVERNRNPASLWLVRWLAFRLMFASGVVKIQSGQAWEALTAMNYHYCTQPLPVGLSYLLHHLPVVMQRVSVAGTFVLQIAGSLLLLFPFARARWYGALAHTVMMVLIQMSGNYCFFNLNAVVLVLPDLFPESSSASSSSSVAVAVVNQKKKKKKNIEDEQKAPTTTATTNNHHTESNRIKKTSCCSSGVLCSALLVCVYLCMSCYVMFMLDTQHATFHLRMRKEVLNEWLLVFLPCLVVAVGVYVALGWLQTVVASWYSSSSSSCSVVGRCVRVCSALLLLPLLLFIYLNTVPPLLQLQPSVRQGWLLAGQRGELVWQAQRWARDYGVGNVASSYGLFRRMTGVGPDKGTHPDNTPITSVARPEVVLEASQDGRTWQEVDFRYKPTALDSGLRVAAPHQPRLDWQMWFLALGNWQQNAWFIRLVGALLQGSEDVGTLLQHNNNHNNNGFKYVRARLFHYDFEEVASWEEAMDVVVGEQLRSWLSPFSSSSSLRTDKQQSRKKEKKKKNVWKRTLLNAEWMPVFERGSAALENFWEQGKWDKQSLQPFCPRLS